MEVSHAGRQGESILCFRFGRKGKAPSELDDVTLLCTHPSLHLHRHKASVWGQERKKLTEGQEDPPFQFILNDSAAMFRGEIKQEFQGCRKNWGVKEGPQCKKHPSLQLKSA